MDEQDHGIRIRCRALHPSAQLPRQMTRGASGFDLSACLDSPLLLKAGDRAAVPTGLVLAIPPGFEGVVRPRSGLALRSGIGLVNSPGTIDADYRGEVKVILINLGHETVTIRGGDRIAQLVIQQVPRVLLEWGDVDLDTERGPGGFGHTGVGPDGGRS